MAFPKDFFQKLKLDQLPFKLSEGERFNGIYADTDKDGFVTALYIYLYGRQTHALKLESEKYEAQEQTIDEFVHDTGTSFIDGWKNFDGTPDPSEDAFIDGLPEPEYEKYVRYINYVRWVQHTLEQFAQKSRGDNPLNACSFCAKNETEVAKLIAGPSAYICNECVDLSHQIVHADMPD